jgi:hypothetical protein
VKCDPRAAQGQVMDLALSRGVSDSASQKD